MEDEIMIKICKQCKNKFYTPATKVHLCSRKCYRKWILIPEHSPNFKKGKPECSVCRKQLTNYKSKLCFEHYRLIIGKCNRGRLRSIEFRKHMSLIQGGNGIPYSDCLHPREFYYIRETIRQRDNHLCQLCHKKQCREKLSVHHIDYNKQNNKSSNLISLCRNCHRKTGYNRDYWYAYFTYLMESKC